LTATANPRKVWKGRNIAIWTVLGGVMAFAMVSLVADLDALGEALAHFPVHYLFPIAMLSLGNYFLRYVKWHWYLKLMGHRVPRWPNLLVFLSGFALTVTPGKVGEFIKAYIVKERFDVPYTTSTAVLLMERFTDVAAIMFLCLTGLFLEFLPLYVALGSFALLVVFIMAIRSRTLALWTIDHLRRFKKLESTADHLEMFYTEGTALLAPWILIQSLLLSIVAWFLEGVGYAIAAWGFGFGTTITEGVFIYSAAIMAGALTLFAGGLGATEGGLIGLGIAFGMNRTVSGGTTLVIRVMTLWFAVLLGLFAFLSTPWLRSLLRAARSGGPERTSEEIEVVAPKEY
jgi:uncharacterized protein (TIRG00374 family)